MSGKVRTKQEKPEDVIAYSELAIRNNAAVVEYCRISMAALSGGTAGLLGLTGLIGFGFYFFAVISLWAMLLMKAGGQWRQFFVSRRSLLTNGFFGGLFVSFNKKFSKVIQVILFSLTKFIMFAHKTYILFWTFLYGMVHVY